MKYIKTYEKVGLNMSISVALFPVHNDEGEYDETDKGKWTTFFGADHNDDIINKYYNIIWRSFFGKDDPCMAKYGTTCRPEFDSYPEELIDIILIISLNFDITEFDFGADKCYWKYSNQKYAEKVKNDYPESEISKMTIHVNSKKEAFNWLEKLESVLMLNKTEQREFISINKNSIKYNI